jgi:hypothetical protein
VQYEGTADIVPALTWARYGCCCRRSAAGRGCYQLLCMAVCHSMCYMSQIECSWLTGPACSFLNLPQGRCGGTACACWHNAAAHLLQWAVLHCRTDCKTGASAATPASADTVVRCTAQAKAC